MTIQRTSGPQITWANIMLTAMVAFSLASAGWVLFSSEIGRLTKDIAEIHLNAVERREHDEFVKRIDGMLEVYRQEFKVIETTRPTTGELQAVGNASSQQISELKTRLQSLEDYMRRPEALAPVTQPQQQH